MPPRIDLTGQRFGKLVVQRLVEMNERGQSVWECLCDCGKIKNVRGTNLTNKNERAATRSCGNHSVKFPIKIGDRFGRLEAIEYIGHNEKSERVFRLKCDCGNETQGISARLRDGSKRSCGCLYIENSREMGKRSKSDLTGQKFGRLTALEDTGDRISGSPMWLCKCDCGTETKVASSNLLSGLQKSCGCLRREHGSRVMTELHRKRKESLEKPLTK